MARSKRGRRDQISGLPKDLIESILERLPLQEAIRTGVLSRNWRYNWVSMKKMNFDDNFSRSLHHSSTYGPYDKVVHDIMMQHDGSIESFSLHAPYSIKSKFLTKALLVASTKGVKFLAINMYELVTPLYSFSQITHLKIKGIQFVKPPPRTLCFPNLIVLSCDDVNFFEYSFEIFMSGCPILERLKMCCCGPTLAVSGQPKFNIRSASLKHLEIYTESGRVFDIDAKNLETLYATLPRSKDSPLTIAAPLNSLKKLDFSCVYMNFDDGASYILSIIQSLPNLVDLEIRTNLLRSATNMEQVTKSSEGSKNKTLHQLQFVKFISTWGRHLSQPEFFILKFLLDRSLSLEKMVVRVVELSRKGRRKISSELKGYNRASPNAKIVVTRIL